MSVIIEIDSVSKTFKQKNRTIQALQNVSLDIHKGDVYGIIGLSGAGKSTLIRALAGLVTPSTGAIRYHGVDIATLKKEGLRQFHQKIGMIFQHFNLLSSRTVWKNIAYPLEIAHVPEEIQKERVEELLGLVGLIDKKEAYPAQLSGGEKQRVGIARALANHPEALLCDEATSALDPRTTQEILTLLKTINSSLGVTIVLITHEMDVIKQICNKVAVIEGGAIVEKGLVTDLFANPQHATTKAFLESGSHMLPDIFFKLSSPNRKLLKLRFKGDVASEPIMSELVRQFNVNPNILLGWIDHLQTLSIGTLIIELTGEPKGIEDSLRYLEQKTIFYEVIEK